MTKGITMNVPYFQAPNDVFEINLGTYELAVYLYLARCSNNGSTAFPSYKTIADKCSMSKRKAVSCVAKMEELGLLEKVVRKKEGENMNYSNIYNLKVDLIEKRVDSEQVAPPSVCSAPPVVQSAPYKELGYKELNKKDIQDADLPKTSVDHQEIVELYHDHCSQLPKVAKLTDQRRKAIKARLSEYSIDDIKQVFETLGSSKFHNGENDREWKATLDWILKPDNFVKMLERSLSKPTLTTGFEKIEQCCAGAGAWEG